MPRIVGVMVLEPVVCAPSNPCAAGPEDGNPRTVYLSTGDSQDLLWPPLDSKASIEAMFTTLRKLYDVERIWWRGGQDEVWANQFVLRSENRPYDLVWRWWKHLAFEKVGTNRLAGSYRASSAVLRGLLKRTLSHSAGGEAGSPRASRTAFRSTA